MERMAAKLEHTARKLPPGPNQAELLQDIGRFRGELTSRHVELGLREKGKS